MSKAERIFYLYRYLSEYGRLDLKEFRDEFEVSQRTAKRDIEYLRDRYSIDVDYDHFDKCYKPRNVLKPFSLINSLLFCASIRGMCKNMALVPVVGHEIEKQALKILDPEQRKLAGSVIYHFPALGQCNALALETLLNGLKQRRVCSINYAKPGADTERRRIEPLRFISYDGQWYALAFCRKNNELRQFSMARIEKAVITDEKFISEIPEEQLDAIDSGSFGIMRTSFGREEPVEVQVRFRGKSAELMRERQWHGEQRLEAVSHEGEDALLLSLPVESFDEVLGRVLFFGPEAEAVSPPEFRELWEVKIREMAALVSREDRG